MRLTGKCCATALAAAAATVVLTACATTTAIAAAPEEFWITAESILWALVEDVTSFLGLFI